MRVMVLGFRGFPDIEGGVETHAQNLYPLLVKMGCKVNVIVRSGYYSEKKYTTWKGVSFLSIWAPDNKLKGVEAFVHTFLGVIYAGIKRPEILHIHSIGPALMAPIARMLGLRVVVTHHGPDYESEKWGFFSKWLLETGEKAGMLFSHKRIAVSNVIKRIIAEKYNRDAVVIPNGVDVLELQYTNGVLKKYGLTSERYILLVSRFVPHKRHDDLIHAFTSAKLNGWKLVLVGEYQCNTDYADFIFSLVEKTNDVVLTGYQTRNALKEIYTNAGIFVMPSSYEGLPIAVLEALSYGLTVLASDIPAHLEIGLPLEQYFRLGDRDELAKKLSKYSSLKSDGKRRTELRKWISQKYSWNKISKNTFKVYNDLLL